MAMATWVKCCFERGRLRHRRRKGTRPLDERYGDIAISGPMDGGWNQVPSYPPEKRSTSLPVSRNGSKHQGEPTSLGKSHSKAHSGTQPFVCITETEHEKSANPPDDKPPNFVYKPASEAFFKDMAEIGRPKCPPPSLSGSIEKHHRQVSTQSASSLEPTLPGEIPCHPFYQKNVSLHRSPSPQPGSIPVLHKNPMSPRRIRENSPTLSNRSRLEEENHDINDEELEKRAVNQLPLNSKVKPKRTKRIVTQELVPSTTELFG
ncbi:hypothetical protein PRK78_004702 [Emydomyces testavorans]|uniref:Uncharacterized protein n=1 Tax=Emydomyces testavorans TaxID=2070801 RepID=A0AAF0IJG1_9EURO|nr:hypothetical protein PRK78_004702 [Emydomyces testavorans]